MARWSSRQPDGTLINHEITQYRGPDPWKQEKYRSELYYARRVAGGAWFNRRNDSPSMPSKWSNHAGTFTAFKSIVTRYVAEHGGVVDTTAAGRWMFA